MNLKRNSIMWMALILAMLCLPVSVQAKVKAPKKECHAYVVMDAGSGEVLFGQDEDKMIYPASTAKIMTAIVSLENGDVNSKIKTEYDVVYGTTLGTYSLGIGAGVKYTFKDLLAMSLISSAADATDSLAVGVFGSKKACVEAMNKKCEELGLKNTHFDNPVGSDIGAGFNETYATAREMALITRYAMTKPLIRDLVKRRSYSPSARDITANSTNWFLRDMIWYDQDKYQVIGTKSGTTNAAGHVFIATAKDKEGHEVICAFFGNVSKDSTFRSIRDLYNYTFKQYKKGKLTLTPANYDVRCSKKLGPIYSKYAYLNCFPGEKDGTFHKNRAITRKELAKMVNAVNGLKGNATVSRFVKSNKKGQVTAVKLATLVEELYPSYLSDEEVEEILANCSNTDNLTVEEKEAFAVMVKEGFLPDKYCSNAKQIINRREAVYFVDKFRDYQMKYQMLHCGLLPKEEVPILSLTALEEEGAEGDTGDAADRNLEAPALHTGITTISSDWAAKMEEYHAQKEAERAARKTQTAPAENVTGAE